LYHCTINRTSPRSTYISHLVDEGERSVKRSYTWYGFSSELTDRLLFIFTSQTDQVSKTCAIYECLALG
uniref:Uncharacterized protein n=1 Tax=Romanomermis culicivorax TaxID=13658 RepID=A0A915IQ96_ROMCU